MTPHFSLKELTITGTGIPNKPSTSELGNLRVTAYGMECVRALIGNKPCIVTSGFRSYHVNKAVGGVPTSDHRKGFAVDFRPVDMTARKAAQIIANSKLPFDQLILERMDKIIHISFNPRLRRQVLRQPGGPGSRVYKGLG